MILHGFRETLFEVSAHMRLAWRCNRGVENGARALE